MPKQSGEVASKIPQQNQLGKEASPGGGEPKADNPQVFAETSVQALEVASAKSGQDAVDLLKSDHREVEDLFRKYRDVKSGKEKIDIIGKICRSLVVHAIIEEELFYPACYEQAADRAALNEAQVEHDGVKVLISELLTFGQDDKFQDAKVNVLSEYVRHHVGE